MGYETSPGPGVEMLAIWKVTLSEAVERHPLSANGGKSQFPQTRSAFPRTQATLALQ